MPESISREVDLIIREGKDTLGLFYSIQSKLGALDSTIHSKTIKAVGNAISPTSASECIKDRKRTSAMLRAIWEGIKKVKQEKPGPVEILEAGCGPTPIGLLAATLSPKDVKLIGIDIHQHSIDYAKRLASFLQIEDRTDFQVNDFIQAPLTGCKPDIIIMEVMDAALINEPQVAAEINMAKRLPSESIIRIPETIIVSANVSTGFWNGKERELDRIITIDKNFRIAAQALDSEEKLIHVKKEFLIPKDRTYRFITLTTKVDMGFGNWLNPSDSLITKTQNYPIQNITSKSITIEYRFGGNIIQIHDKEA